MTWEERLNMHVDAHREHANKAREALRAFNAQMHLPGCQRDWSLYDTYRTELKEANRQHGIVMAMYTRKFNKEGE